MPTALDVQDLRKVYRLYRSPKDRLFQLLGLKSAGARKEFAALNGVSVAVEQGETLGIVGHNGSGKSTLLKILCGVIRPTSGNVQVNGRVASLLELGAGFHPEFSGRDNVYMTGALMGLKRAEMNRRIADIEAFADIGEFIDQPVKHYSSGMFVRLAFSTAISVDPDILVIDEALAVGDIAFQLKCVERLKSFQRSGRTIVLVSHQIHVIRNFCTRALWLDHGMVRAEGDVVSVTDSYADVMAESAAAGREDKTVMHDGESVVSIEQVVVRNKGGEVVSELGFGESFTVCVSYRLTKEYPGIVGAVAILNRERINVCGLNTKRDGMPLPFMPGVYELVLHYPDSIVLPGTYRLRVAFFESSAVGRIAVRHDAASFTVRSTAYKAEGLCLLSHHWTVNALSDSDVKSRRSG
ncbi:MAG: ABC transporter ATP-binding protein [Nitrospirota bacterium]